MEYIMIEVGKNIRYLREALDIKVDQFAEMIGISKGTISRYENGIVEPNDYSILNSISNFFGITIDQLTSIDFTNDNNLLPQKIEACRLMKLWPYMYPTVKPSNSTTENDIMFMLALKASEVIEFGAIHYFTDPNVAETNYDLLQKALYCYSASITNNNTIEAKANILGTILQLWNTERNLPQINRPKYNKQKYKTSEFLKAQSKISLRNNNDWSDDQKEFYKTFNDKFLEIIKELKSTVYYEIADFYLAMKYYLGMVDSPINIASLNTIGFEMLRSLAQTDNQYAISFLDNFIEIMI